jgi:hypothetical protein
MVSQRIDKSNPRHREWSNHARGLGWQGFGLGWAIAQGLKRLSLPLGHPNRDLPHINQGLLVVRHSTDLAIPEKLGGGCRAGKVAGWQRSPNYLPTNTHGLPG